jgi:ATP-dependent Lon protease
VRDKALAAQRAGVKTVVLPKENEPDLAELPSEAREQLSFVLADSIDQVLEVAFDGSAAARARRATPLPERKAAHAA